MGYFEPENGVSHGLNQKERLEAIGTGPATGNRGDPLNPAPGALAVESSKFVAGG